MKALIKKKNAKTDRNLDLLKPNPLADMNNIQLPEYPIKKLHSHLLFYSLKRTQGKTNLTGKK